MAPPHDAPTFLFAGGGSGGHIAPSLAIAERIADLDGEARALFVCSERPVDRAMLEQAGARFDPLPASPPSRRPAALARFALDFARSVRQAVALVRRERVTRVVAMGGFVAAPVVAAARLAGAKVTLVNLDAPPGKANRGIARRSGDVLSAVEVTQPAGFCREVVGVPIRRCALARDDAATCRVQLNLDPVRHTLLVTGASQGASSLNAMLVELVGLAPSAFDGWQVLHLCGAGEADPILRAYAGAGIPARVEPFCHEMGLAWGSADLAVTRAGASSVAEAWANAVPSLLMPYPHHADRHQYRNAAPMVAAGGAVISDDPANADDGGAALLALLRDGPRREAMRGSLRARPAPDAAATVARILLESVPSRNSRRRA